MVPAEVTRTRISLLACDLRPEVILVTLLPFHNEASIQLGGRVLARSQMDQALPPALLSVEETMQC